MEAAHRLWLCWVDIVSVCVVCIDGSGWGCMGASHTDVVRSSGGLTMVDATVCGGDSYCCFTIFLLVTLSRTLCDNVSLFPFLLLLTDDARVTIKVMRL